MACSYNTKVRNILETDHGVRIQIMQKPENGLPYISYLFSVDEAGRPSALHSKEWKENGLSYHFFAQTPKTPFSELYFEKDVPAPAGINEGYARYDSAGRLKAITAPKGHVLNANPDYMVRHHQYGYHVSGASMPAEMLAHYNKQGRFVGMVAKDEENYAPARKGYEAIGDLISGRNRYGYRPVRKGLWEGYRPEAFGLKENLGESFHIPMQMDGEAIAREAAAFSQEMFRVQSSPCIHEHAADARPTPGDAVWHMAKPATIRQQGR